MHSDFISRNSDIISHNSDFTSCSYYLKTVKDQR